MPALSATEIAFLMVACQQAVLCGGWLVGAVALRLERRPVMHWAAYALFSGVSLVLFVWATQTRSEPIRALANVCVVTGLLLMHRGVRHFVELPADARAYFAVLAAVLAASWVGLAPERGAFRVISISGLLGLLCLATARDIFRHARDRLMLRWGFWLAVPQLLGAVVFLLRAGRAMVAPQTVVAELTANSSLNIGSALMFMLLALVFHLALVALVATRLTTELRRLSRHDSLTHLLNRGAMDEALREEARRAQRAGTPFAVLMLDADHFKTVNDRFGHAAGDEALRHLASLLQGEMREVDRVGRFGGEEFIVVLPGTTAAEALGAAERLKESLARSPWMWQGQTLPLTMSSGAASWNGDGDDVAQLLRRADKALYRAKGLGRNRCELG